MEGLIEDYVRVGWDFIDNIAFETWIINQLL